MSTVLVALAFLLSATTGCSPKSSASNNETGNNNQDPRDASVHHDGQVHIDGAWGTFDAMAFDAEICGAQTEEIEIINLGDPPDLLIVLDRSGSMMMPIDWMDFTSPSRWAVMKTALSNLVNARDANIRFGLTVFPTDNDCGVDPGARVEIDLHQGDAIVSYLNSISWGGNTPAQYALQEALAYYNTIPVNPEGQYVLFATDGLPNCGGDPPDVDIDSNEETVQAVQALAAAGINTFVLGFADVMIGLNSQVLNDAAQAGLEPRQDGPPYYYFADDEASLQEALDTIAGGVFIPSCSFELTELPPVPDDVTVYFDGVPVPRTQGHNHGWNYHPDGGTITFFGDYCDMLQSGQVDEVNFIFGCPGPIVD